MIQKMKTSFKKFLSSNSIFMKIKTEWDNYKKLCDEHEKLKKDIEIINYDVDNVFAMTHSIVERLTATQINSTTISQSKPQKTLNQQFPLLDCEIEDEDDEKTKLN